MYKIPEFLWLEFQSWGSIASFFPAKMQDCHTMTTQVRTPVFPLTHSLLFYSLASRTNFTFTLKTKSVSRMVNYYKAWLRVVLDAILTNWSELYTEVQDFLQAIVPTQWARSGFQQGHILVHSPTTSHLSQWKYSPYTQSQCSKNPDAVTSATRAAASLAKTKSHRKC